MKNRKKITFNLFSIRHIDNTYMIPKENIICKIEVSFIGWNISFNQNINGL